MSVALNSLLIWTEDRRLAASFVKFNISDIAFTSLLVEKRIYIAF